MSNFLVDPIALLQQRANSPRTVETASAATAEVPYELPLVPRPGAQVQRMTIASSYRRPIPVLFEASTCTTYPVSSEG